MAGQQDTPAPVGTLERLLGSTEPVRRALYPVVVSIVALLVAYGLLDAQRVPLWLALAVTVLGIGGTEAARAVAYAPATVAEYGDRWKATLDDEFARGVAHGIERARAELEATDPPGEHAVDRPESRSGAEVTAFVEAQQWADVQEPATGLMRAPSRAERCREVEAGRRCVLGREHTGPHMMTTG